jgi:hypothetical protein
MNGGNKRGFSATGSHKYFGLPIELHFSDKPVRSTLQEAGCAVKEKTT